MEIKTIQEALDSLVSKSDFLLTCEENRFKKTIQMLIKLKSTVNDLYSYLPEGKTRLSSKDICIESINDAIAAFTAMSCDKIYSEEEKHILDEILFLTKD